MKQHGRWHRGDNLKKRSYKTLERLGLVGDNKLKLSSHTSSRIRFLMLLCFLALGVFGARFAYLGFIPNQIRQKVLQTYEKQSQVKIQLAAPRTEITDRRGRPLAINVQWPSIYVVPRLMPRDATSLRRFARQMKITYRKARKLRKTGRAFAWLERKVSPSRMKKFGDLSRWKHFLGVREEFHRIYPEGNLASHALGYVNIDNAGLDGIELAKNHLLMGKPVHFLAARDARGRTAWVNSSGSATSPIELPAPLQLTIDITIQNLVEDALAQVMISSEAEGASAVVVDVPTGEILAISSLPDYNPNTPKKAQKKDYRYRAIRDGLELGSVVKPFLLAKAIDKGIVDASTKIFCEEGRYRIKGGYISDTHEYEYLTVKEIIKYSSNICTFKVMKMLGKEALLHALRDSYLASPSGLNFPGEARTYLMPPEKWSEMRYANLSFGQGMSMSPLQLAHAMTALANGGISPGLHMVKGEKTPRMKRYVSEKTAAAVIDMMRTVVEEEGGTAPLAKIEGIAVAGKTGTAEKYNVELKRYADERISSFVGVVPANKPKLAIVVVVDNPKKRPAYGGLIAAPVFKDIAIQSLHYLNAVGDTALLEDDNL